MGSVALCSRNRCPPFIRLSVHLETPERMHRRIPREIALAELVGLQPDIILAGGTPATATLQRRAAESFDHLVGAGEQGGRNGR